MQFSPEQLRRARILAGLSQRALARRAGVSESLVVRAEGGASPQVTTVKSLADALSIPVADLYTDEAAAVSR